jgi:RNA polymerase sigma factor (sigma-70 family)
MSGADSTAQRHVTMLYEANAVSLARLALVMLGDHDAAEDVVQDAFFGLHRRWDHLSDSAALTCLRASVLKGCHDAMRGRPLPRTVAGEQPPEPAGAAMPHGQEHRAILTAVRCLPARQREALVLRYYLDMSEEWAAAVMHVSAGTVKAATARAIAAAGDKDDVRAALQAEGGRIREVRPLRLASAGAPRRPRTPRWGRRRGWLVSATAAAVAAALAVTVVTIRSSRNEPGIPVTPKPTATPASAAASAVAAAAAITESMPAVPAPAGDGIVPRYVVGLTDARDNGKLPRIVVTDTRAGRTIASIAGPKDTAYIGASGAADGVTFVVGTTIWPSPNAGAHKTSTTGPTGWYLLRIDPGAPAGARLTRLPIPAAAADSPVRDMALSPLGTELAVLSDPRQTAVGEGWLRVFSVRTGQLLRAWAITDQTIDFSGVIRMHDLSWVHGDAGLAFAMTTERDGVPAPTQSRVEMRVVDVAAGAAGKSTALAAAAAAGQPYPGAASLLAASRVVWLQPVTTPPYGNYPFGSPNLCDIATLTGDGTTVICAISYWSHDGHDTLMWLAYQVTDPRAPRVIARLPVKWPAKTFATMETAAAGVRWASLDGRTVLASWEIDSVSSAADTLGLPVITAGIGVASGGRLTPLVVARR